MEFENKSPDTRKKQTNPERECGLFYRTNDLILTSHWQGKKEKELLREQAKAQTLDPNGSG